MGPLIAFGETAATAWAVLLGGGALSQLHATGLPLRVAAAAALALVAVVAIGAVVIAVARRRGGVHAEAPTLDA